MSAAYYGHDKWAEMITEAIAELPPVEPTPPPEPTTVQRYEQAIIATVQKYPHLFPPDPCEEAERAHNMNDDYRLD